MNELRCNCSRHQPLVMKYDDKVVEGQCRKCKGKHVLAITDGKLQEVKPPTKQKQFGQKPKGNIAFEDFERMMKNTNDIIY